MGLLFLNILMSGPLYILKNIKVSQRAFVHVVNGNISKTQEYTSTDAINHQRGDVITCL